MEDSFEVESVLGQGSTFLVSLPTGKAHLSKDRIGSTRSLASTAVGATPYVEEALRWLPDAGQPHLTDEILTIPELLPVPLCAGTERRWRTRVAGADSRGRR